MSKKLTLAGALLGAMITSTSALANGASCGAGKCAAEMNKNKSMTKGGSCGAGKCAADMKMSGDMHKSDDMKKVVKTK